MFDLLNKYADLKAVEEERDALIKEAKEAFKAQLAEINAEYPDLDGEIDDVRDDIQVEVSALGGTYEVEGFIVEIQQRPSWDIGNASQLVSWLNNHDKADLWDYSFKKAEINKICTGLSIANIELPSGVEKVLTPTLTITLPRGELIR